MTMIIAIDGPAASGKGTIAKQVAAIYGLPHLDTGLIYRAVAKAVLDAGYAPDNVEKAIDAAIALDPIQFDESALKAPAITEAASVVAAIPEVRQALMNYQRAFATKPPGAVLDGRDIGTVIAPGADVKIFVVATPEVRAARRTAEMRARGRACRRKRGPGRPVAAGRARFPADRGPPEGRARRALARYHAFGYRRRIPGCRRHHRSRPNGPKALMTALSSLEVSPFASLRLAHRTKLCPDRLALAPPPA